MQAMLDAAETRTTLIPDKATVEDSASSTTREAGHSDWYNRDTRHVVHFIRRHDHGDALHISSSVLYATVGLVETQSGRTDETVILIRAIAGEIYSIAREILDSPPHHLEQEGDQFFRGTKRLHAGEVVEWEQATQEENQEVEEADGRVTSLTPKSRLLMKRGRQRRIEGG